MIARAAGRRRVVAAARWPLVACLAACGGRPASAPVIEREPPPPGTDAAPAVAPPPRGGAIEVEAVAPDPRGRDGVHGMIVFGGGDELYVSHLPMTHPPHDVQLVARVRITAVDGARPDRFDALYTLAPERFRLDDLLAGARTTFRAALHRGNFEAGAPRVATVEVAIAEIVIAHPIGRGADDAYYLLGGADGWWAVHRIGAAAAFDAIAAVTFAHPPVPGVYRAPRRLVGGDTLGEGAGAFVATGVRELSCLLGPDFTAACPPPPASSSSAPTPTAGPRRGASP